MEEEDEESSGPPASSSSNNRNVPVLAPLALQLVSERGTGDGHFDQPRGLAVDDTANELFVVDQRNHRVQVFTIAPLVRNSTTTAASKTTSTTTPASYFLFHRKFGARGSGQGQLLKPSGLDGQLAPECVHQERFVCAHDRRQRQRRRVLCRRA